MVKVYFNFTTGFFHIKLDSTQMYFSDIIQLLKENYYCSYSNKYREWYHKSAITIQNIIDDIKAYDKIFISQEDKDLIKDLIYPRDSSFKNLKIIQNKEWFEKHKPILGKTPYENYQLDTVKFCSSRNRSIQDLAPGTGKTYIESGVLANFLKNTKIEKILWVCKPEGVLSTYFKILQFLPEYYTENDIGICATDNREIEDLFNKKIILTNYTTFRLTEEYYHSMRVKSRKIKGKIVKTKKAIKPTIRFDKWCDKSKAYIILDEAQSIKNYDTQQSHIIHLYKDFFDFRTVMSGTLHYKVTDGYSIAKFLVPESLPYSFSEWRKYMADREETKFIKKFRPDRVKEFKERVLNPLQISFGEEVLDLPPFIEEPIYIQMNNKMREYYKKYIEYMVEGLQNKKEDELNIQNVENYFFPLVMFTSDPILVKKDFPYEWDFNDNPKIEVTKSLLEKHLEENNEKVIIWSNHPKTINELKKVLKKYNPYVIHGDEKTSVKKSERFEMVKEFRESKDRNLLICSYVLQSSIDIQEANVQIYYDIQLDTDKFNQSKKRTWRLEQKKTVWSYYLLFNNSIDIYIWNEVIMRKEKVRNILTSKEYLELQDYKNIFNAKQESYLSYIGA